MARRTSPARALALAVLLGAPVPARAAHPMLSEDTGTQGKGNVELELGLASSRDGDTRAFEFGPQLSYGVAGSVDLIVRPAWLEVRDTAAAGGRRDTGVGDTALDFKWRFREA
jgi:hypothetical protein